jgi:hypothetical protein
MILQSFEAERESTVSSGECQYKEKRMYPQKVISELTDISIDELVT